MFAQRLPNRSQYVWVVFRNLQPEFTDANEIILNARHISRSNQHRRAQNQTAIKLECRALGKSPSWTHRTKLPTNWYLKNALLKHRRAIQNKIVDTRSICNEEGRAALLLYELEEVKYPYMQRYTSHTTHEWVQCIARWGSTLLFLARQLRILASRNWGRGQSQNCIHLSLRSMTLCSNAALRRDRPGNHSTNHGCPPGKHGLSVSSRIFIRHSGFIKDAWELHRTCPFSLHAPLVRWSWVETQEM